MRNLHMRHALKALADIHCKGFRELGQSEAAALGLSIPLQARHRRVKQLPSAVRGLCTRNHPVCAHWASVVQSRIEHLF